MVMLLLGCSNGTLYISGDSESVGAEVLIDGRKVGVMEKHVYVGSTSKNPVVVKREQKNSFMPGYRIKKGSVFSSAHIKVPNGEHELTVVGVDGRRLKKRFKIRGENYLNVSFEKMTIEGE